MKWAGKLIKLLIVVPILALGATLGDIAYYMSHSHDVANALLQADVKEFDFRKMEDIGVWAAIILAPMLAAFITYLQSVWKLQLKYILPVSLAIGLVATLGYQTAMAFDIGFDHIGMVDWAKAIGSAVLAAFSANGIYHTAIAPNTMHKRITDGS